jgi:osmoprotectant transport system permease protein
MTKKKVLWSIEIPNSIPTIFSGLRNSAIINIGTTTIASAVGAGGLGEIIFIGLSYFDYAMIIGGAIPVSLMAIFTDVILAFIEKSLTSKGLRLID